MKNKSFLLIALILLFLVTSFGHAKAATYYENSVKVTHYLKEYIYQPTADLVEFTGDHLALTFNSFPPFVIATKEYFRGFAFFGEKTEKSLGTLFLKTGRLLAIIPNNLPNISKVSFQTADIFSSAISKFKDSGIVFKKVGDVLAIIPNSLVNFEGTNVKMGSLFIVVGQKVNNSLLLTQLFFKETLNNFSRPVKKQTNFYTQKLLTRAKNNLDYNFIDKIIGIQQVKGSAPSNIYESK